MDQIDKHILRLMQRDARSSISEIGKQVRLSLPAVKDRIRKLEKNGVIQGYSAILDGEKLGKNICCYCLLVLRNKSPENDDRFLQFIEKERDIQECHCISGEYEFLLKIITESPRTLEALLSRMRAAIPVLRTNSFLVLSSAKGHHLYIPNSPVPPFPE